MNERDFCYWLQGFFEITEQNTGLTSEQVEMIKSHLALVFNKVTYSNRINPNDYEAIMDNLRYTYNDGYILDDSKDLHITIGQQVTC